MTLTLVIDNSHATQALTYKTIEKHYRENRESLVSRYSHFLHSKERAEDVVQEAYTRACFYWTAAPSNLTDFSRWLYTILGNCLKDNHKDEITKGATNRKDDNAEEGAEGPAIPAIIYKQVVERINAKPSSQSHILTLALLQQERPSEIEKLVPENAAGIRKIVSRFRKEIKQEFGWNI